MDASDYLPDSMARGLRFLRQEFAPSPWRINLAMRLVLASAIVLIVSMTLEVPALALSLIAVFYTTQSNVVITRMAGLLFILATTLGLGIFLVLYIFTADHPLLRIIGASLVFFTSAYLMRILKIGTMFFIVAIVVIYLQSLVDEVPWPDAMVRLTLWVWVVINYAILVTLLVNTLFLPIEPALQLKAEIHRQLGEVGDGLLRLEQGAAQMATPNPAHALAGLLALQKLLKFAAMRDKLYRADEAYQLAVVASVSRLARAATALPAATEMPAPALQVALRQLRLECAALDAAVQENTRYRMIASSQPAATSLAALGDMWRTLGALSSFGRAPPETQGHHEEPMVVPDAFTNPAYVRFALKTLLAVLSGYVFYNAVNWQGIHTIMLTCLIVALPSLGASTQKALLRVGGALVGSGLALFMVVFVIPWLDSIVGLLLMALPVIGLAAWIAAGSERISYAGIQVMFTFALSVLEHFGPTKNLTEIRDRMVGILLGVVLAGAIQTLLWPEGEGGALRCKLAELVRSVAALLRSSGGHAADGAPLAYAREQMQAWAGVGAAEAMLARVAIEPDWNEGANETLTARAQALLASVGEILRADEALVGQLATAALQPQAGAAANTIRAAVADELERYAVALQADPPGARAPTTVITGMPVEGQPLLAAEQDLARALGGLPDWLEPAPGSSPLREPVRP